MLLMKGQMKLSELAEYYNNILENHGDMDIVTFKEEYFDDEGWFISDQYEKVNDLLVGYTKDVYLYDEKYYTDLPHEFQKNNNKKVFIIDEI